MHLNEEQRCATTHIEYTDEPNEPKGEYQCPNCRRWFCGQCAEQFMQLEPLFWLTWSQVCPACYQAVQRNEKKTQQCHKTP